MSKHQFGIDAARGQKGMERLNRLLHVNDLDFSGSYYSSQSENEGWVNGVSSRQPNVIDLQVTELLFEIASSAGNNTGVNIAGLRIAQDVEHQNLSATTI